MTEEFYLKHKDKSWELPKFPDDDIDETSASQVVNWVFNEMKAGNMGWLEVNLLNVKGGDFIPIGYHHMGQIETQVLDHRNLYKPQSNNVSECFMVKDKKWVPVSAESGKVKRFSPHPLTLHFYRQGLRRKFKRPVVGTPSPLRRHEPVSDLTGPPLNN